MLTTVAAPTRRVRVQVDLADGGVAHLRPLGRGESGPLLAVFEAMSTLSRAGRYLTGMPYLPPGALRRLADVGDPRHVAWVATVDDQPVGIARYVAIDGCLVEVAFEVADQHHHRGLGGALLDAIATVARANGYSRVTATVHPTNRSSVRLLDRLGLRLRLSDGLLEGEAPLRLPFLPRVDRVAVLDVLEGQAQVSWSGLNHDCRQLVGSAQ